MFSDKEKFWRQLRLGLLGLAIAGCASCWEQKPRTSRPIDLVPSEAEVIAVVDYRGFLNNEVLRRVFDISQVERSLAAIGVSSEDILSIAGFAKINVPSLAGGGRGTSEGSPAQFGVIVQRKGGFGAVFKALSESGWVVGEYEGKSLCTAPEENMAAALIGSDIIAAGTPGAVRRVISVAVGRSLGAMEPGSGSDCGAILRRIGITGEINIAISFSHEMKMAAKEVSRSAGMFGGMTGASIFGQLFDVLGSGRGVALSFRGRKDGISSRLIFVAGDAATAKLIAGLVGVAKIMIPRISDFGPMEDAAEVVRGLHVSSENNLVLIEFKIPETVIGRVPRGHP